MTAREHRRTISATAQWPLLAVALLGGLAGTAGVYWDLGWHYDRGRDTVLSPPHLLIGVGAMTLGLALVALSVLVHRRRDAREQIVLPLREYGGITYSPLLLVAFVAGLVPPVALAIDEVWHQLFGLDTSLWSPTHLLAILAGPVATISVSALIAWEMNQTDPARARPELRGWRGVGLAGWLAVATFAAVAITLMLPWAEYDFDLPQWDLALAAPLLVAMLAFPTFLAAEAVGRRWTATFVLGTVAALRFLISGFVIATDQTAPDVVIPVLAGLAVDLIVIAGSGTLRSRTLMTALIAFPVAVVGSEAIRLQAIGQDKWLDGLYPYGGVAALAAGVVAGYLGVVAGRALRPSDHASLRPEGVRSERSLPRIRTAVGAVFLGALALAATASAGGESVDPAKTMVPAQMELVPGEPRAGETVTIRVSGFETAREVSPRIPTGETVERTDQPAPFLDEPRREPQVIAYYGGTWLREPLERRGDETFEARVTFPHDGNWRIGPFFYNGDFRWAERKGVEIRDADATSGDLPAKQFDLELAAEGDPVDAPTWLKPIAFAFLGLLFAAALWLVVVQLRIVRRGGIAAA